MKEIRIGICDDEVKYHNILQEICEKYFTDSKIKRVYKFFKNGEEVIEFCEDKNNQIDILFLDIEMGKLDGILLKNTLSKNDCIQKIIFVTSHKEAVYDAFSSKTMGFILKPISEERVFEAIASSIEEINSNINLEFVDIDGNHITEEVENIIYLKADTSYTYLYSNRMNDSNRENYILAKRFGDVEKMLEGSSVIRVHKSYMINLEHIKKVTDVIELNGIDEKIPIGRAYSKAVKNKYFTYTKRRVLNRI